MAVELDSLKLNNIHIKTKLEVTEAQLKDTCAKLEELTQSHQLLTTKLGERETALSLSESELSKNQQTLLRYQQQEDSLKKTIFQLENEN
jgi:chromosome segregation ATPase